jgi:3-phytase
MIRRRLLEIVSQTLPACVSLHWAFGLMLFLGAARAQIPLVPVSGQTTQTPNAVDVAIWIHPTDVRQSIIIGTDPSVGLLTYGIDGQQLPFTAPGQMNSVDLRYNFRLDGGGIPLIAATNQFNKTLALFTIDPVPVQQALRPVGTLQTGTNVLGLSMYRSNANGSYYAFVTDTDGGIQQWGLAEDGGRVMGNLVRTLPLLSSQAEGIVSDDAYGVLYVAEDLVGIWKYGAEPDAGTARVLVDSTADGGHLVARVKGLSIYRASNGAGYLLASSQGNATIAVYGREPGNRFLGAFQVDGGAGIGGLPIPAIGLDVTNFGLGLDGGFPEGLFVLQDSRSGANFKLVSWRAIAQAFVPPLPPLLVDTLLDPRQTETLDGSIDGGKRDGGDGGGGGGPINPGGVPGTSTGCSCAGGPSGILVAALGAMVLGLVRSRRRRDRE